VQGATTTIPGLTQEISALTFPYSFSPSTFTSILDPTLYVIRNSAQVNIVNHSGGKVTGPNPKATWGGGTPPSCTQACGCELTQGYWSTHNNDVCTTDPTSRLLKNIRFDDVSTVQTLEMISAATYSAGLLSG